MAVAEDEMRRENTGGSEPTKLILPNETHVVSTSLNLPESPHEQGYIHGNPTGETGPPPRPPSRKAGRFCFWGEGSGEAQEGNTEIGHERCKVAMAETSRGGSNLPTLSYLFGGRLDGLTLSTAS
jgi:hypothetical protein